MNKLLILFGLPSNTQVTHNYSCSFSYSYSSQIMKAVVALVFLGLVALSTAGVLYSAPALATAYHQAPALATAYHHAPIAYSPIAYTSAAYPTSANYRLTLDTSLPGSAYAAYPNAAAPTAYGYGVIKVL